MHLNANATIRKDTRIMLIQLGTSTLSRDQHHVTLHRYKIQYCDQGHAIMPTNPQATHSLIQASHAVTGLLVISVSLKWVNLRLIIIVSSLETKGEYILLELLLIESELLVAPCSAARKWNSGMSCRAINLANFWRRLTQDDGSYPSSDRFRAKVINFWASG